jgi:hypothetical protein
LKFLRNYDLIISTDLVIYIEKMAVTLCSSLNCIKIGPGSNSGIQEFRNSGI